MSFTSKDLTKHSRQGNQQGFSESCSDEGYEEKLIELYLGYRRKLTSAFYNSLQLLNKFDKIFKKQSATTVFNLWITEHIYHIFIAFICWMKRKFLLIGTCVNQYKANQNPQVFSGRCSVFLVLRTESLIPSLDQLQNPAAVFTGKAEKCAKHDSALLKMTSWLSIWRMMSRKRAASAALGQMTKR